MKTTPKSKNTDHQKRNSLPLAEQLAAVQSLVAAMPYNTNKAHEFGQENAVAPPRGAGVASDSPTALTSTQSEVNVASKADALDRTRSDASGQAMTTNQGVLFGDNPNSL